jgi:hypothetical protein
MNALTRTRGLNERFKQFQLLPELPMALSCGSGARQLVENDEDSNEHPKHTAGVMKVAQLKRLCSTKTTPFQTDTVPVGNQIGMACVQNAECCH